MSKTIVSSLFVYFIEVLLILNCGIAHAQNGPAFWSNSADLVIVGRAVNIRSEMPADFTEQGLDLLFHSPKTFQPKLVTLDVYSVYKADQANIHQVRLVVFPFRSASTPSHFGTWSGPSPRFTQFDASANYLIFARRESGSAYYELLSDDPSLPSTFPFAVSAPLSNVWTSGKDLNMDFLNQLTIWLSSGDVSLKINALAALADYRAVMVQGPWAAIYTGYPDKISGSSDLAKFAQDVTIPVVRRYYSDPDASIRQKSLFTGASLQDVEAIHIIGSYSSSDSAPWARFALSQYHSSDALTALAPLLNSQSDDIRAGAAKAISNIASEVSIPWFLKSLDDVSKDVRSYALQGLETDAYAAHLAPSGHSGPSGTDAECIAFWKNWAVQNRALIEKIEQNQNAGDSITTQ